jgi:predicted Zn-dependent protease
MGTINLQKKKLESSVVESSSGSVFGMFSSATGANQRIDIAFQNIRKIVDIKVARCASNFFLSQIREMCEGQPSHWDAQMQISPI